MKVRVIKLLKNCGALVTAMAGVLVLLYLAFFGAVMNDSFLKDVNIKIGTHEKLGMSEEDLGKVAQSMVLFTKGETDTLQVTVTMNGVERPFYNEKEILHIQDVRELVKEVRIFVIGCGIVFLAGMAAFICNKDIARPAKGFLISLAIVAVLAAAIGVLAVIDMQTVIHGFHHIFFDNDLWIMERDKDMVIWLFMHDMYADAIIRIGIWLAVLLVPFTILSLLTVRKDQNRKKEKQSVSV